MLLKRRRYIVTAVLMAMLCGLLILREIIGPNVIIHNKASVPIEQVTFNLGHFTVEKINFDTIHPNKHKKRRFKISEEAPSTLNYIMNGKFYTQNIDVYLTKGMAGNLELHVAEDGVTSVNKLRLGF